jgi:predicted lipoprotein with Yx(FWY)xxD motif
MRSLLALAALFGAALLGPATLAGAPPVLAQAGPPSAQVRAHPQFGEILVDPRGMTLYVTTRDILDASACFGTCSQVWPPLLAGQGEPVPGDGLRVPLNTLARPDGGRQITYAGRPLYLFSRDAQPGEANGQGFDGVWFVMPAVSPNVQPSPAVSAGRTPDLGIVVTDPRGRTLYRYAQDRPNLSACYDQCAQTWPPLTTVGPPFLQAGMGGTVGAAPRRDGSVQVTYNGFPLYYHSGDTGPGTTTGQGVGNAWFVVEAQPPS